MKELFCRLMPFATVSAFAGLVRIKALWDTGNGYHIVTTLFVIIMAVYVLLIAVTLWSCFRQKSLIAQKRITTAEDKVIRFKLPMSWRGVIFACVMVVCGRRLDYWLLATVAALLLEAAYYGFGKISNVDKVQDPRAAKMTWWATIKWRFSPR